MQSNGTSFYEAGTHIMIQKITNLEAEQSVPPFITAFENHPKMSHYDFGVI